MASSDQVQRRIQQYGVLRQELIRDIGPLLSERPEAAEGIARFFDTLEELLRKKQTRACRATRWRPGAARRPGHGSRWVALQVCFSRRESKSMTTRWRQSGFWRLVTSIASTSTSAWDLFRAVLALQQLFIAGAIRLSTGPGGLRPPPVRPAAGASLHGLRERMQAYRRCLWLHIHTAGAGRSAQCRLPQSLRPVRHERRRVLP